MHLLRQMLKMEAVLRPLDFDSTQLAYELTMIDKELFLKIPEKELEILLSHRNSKNTPNINTFIAFSHRISNLIATEVIREDNLEVSLENCVLEKIQNRLFQVRAKIMVRFINVASKCERLNNFHSCLSVLSGLQCASVYRLHGTWAHLRKYYSMKYLQVSQTKSIFK